MQEFKQSQIFLIFLIIGFIIGIIYDFFRCMRKNIRTSDLVTNIQDIIFCAITGIIIIRTLILINYGQMRIYIFLALFIGIIVYYISISKIIVIFFSYFFKIIKKYTIFDKFLKKKINKMKGFSTKM